MHVLFVHQTYPSQFGHLARYLTERHGFQCTFVCRNVSGSLGGVECIQYPLKGGATEQTHFCSRTFENGIWHAHGVYEALAARPDVRPDLVVGHSGFGSTMFLPQLYKCPIINYFEYFYYAYNSDIDFRPEFQPTEIERLRALARNAMILLDLEACTAGYSPTQWQRSLISAAYRDKIDVIFDGVDLSVWHPHPRGERQLRGRNFPEGLKLVTYAARGFEAMRGFDIFIETAKRICAARSDVIFLIAGEDKVCYGGDHTFTGGRPYGEWVTAKGGVDRSKFVFLGRLEQHELARLFSMSDLHIYLTVPFILSWSVFDALACGATLLASATPPVQEVIRHGENGLLAGFYDADKLAEEALKVLAAPDDFRHLGQAGLAMVRDKYSLDVCLPQMLRLYERVVNTPRPVAAPVA